MEIAVVTGTSTGIGFATSVRLARHGYCVFAGMRNPGKAGPLRAAAADAGLTIEVIELDVTSTASVNRAFETVSGHGPVDVLVNNAGIGGASPLEITPEDEHRQMFETNYFGAIRCIQAVLPAMRARRSGCIINVASIAGRIASSPMAPYTASKFALEALSESLAQEAKPFNVRVAIVEPGIIDTAMARRVESAQTPSPYPQQRRFAAMFTASLKNPVPPSVVGEKVLEIVESGTWQLRHPVGPDAVPFLQWRKAMSDEEWVAWGALGDDAWYDRVKADFGMDARPNA